MGKKKILLCCILSGIMILFVSCGKKSNGLFADVIPEKDKMVTLLEYQREASVSFTMSDTEEVDRLLEQIDRLSVEPAKEWTNDLVTLPIYGIAVMQKPEGDALEAHITYGYWSNGYWVAADGQAYKMKLPVEKLKTDYAWEEEKPFSSIRGIAAVGPLVLDEKGWKKELLTEAQPAATIPGLVTTATKEGDTLTVSIDNQGESAYMGDKYDYVIEVCLDEVWYDLPFAVWGRFERGDVPWFEPGVKGTLSYSLDIYGSLPEGIYRLVTGSDERRESLVEFVLDSTAGKQPESLSPTATPAPTDIPETVLLPIDAAHFGSTVFCEFIAKEYDSNQDGFLSEKERNEVLSIETNKQYNIDNVDGLEIFPNLESLFFWGTVRKVVIRNHPSLQYVGGTEGAIDELLIENCPKLEAVGFSMYGVGDVTISNSGQKVSFGVDEPLTLGKLTFDENVIVELKDGASGAELFFVQADGSLLGRKISREGEETEQVIFEKPATGVPFDEAKIKDALKASVFVIGEGNSQEDGQNVEEEGYRIEIKESPTPGKWKVVLTYPYRDTYRGYIVGNSTFVMEADERPDPNRFFFTVAEIDDRVRYREYSPKWGLTAGISCSLNLMYAADAGKQYVATITAQEKICLILPVDLNSEAVLE